MAGQEKPKPQEQEKWYFTKEQLQNSPSKRCGLDADKELAYRQQAANLIQDMGQRLQVSQLCINTAIVYMHRFYAFHSFTQFHRNAIAAAALFLAAKVEEQPRKLEYVIKVAHVCLHRGERGETVSQLTAEQYQEQAQDLVFNENVLLQTLGFDVAIDHPHTHVVRTCHLVKAPKDLAQTSYFMASNSLHLTTMCLQYRPTIVACFCIHLASKWSNWAIPQSSEGRHWFSYVDRSVTSDLLEKLTAEFLHIFDKCPSRLKKKMKTMSSNSGGSPHSGAAHSSSQSTSQQVASPFDKKHSSQSSDDFDKAFDREYEREKRRQPVPGGYVPAPAAAPPAAPPPAAPPAPTPPNKIDYTVYREKREREERERREERDRQRQAQIQQARPPAQQPRPSAQPTTHHQRPSTAQPHHKQAHHAWPHHAKPPHHKIPHDHRSHHRPPTAQPSTSSNPAQNPNQFPQQQAAAAEVPQRTRPPSLFSPENVTTPTVAATNSVPRRPPERPVQRPQRPDVRPQQQPQETQRPPSPRKRQETATAVVREMQPPTILSPFGSPPPKEVPKQQRQRIHSNSEPELVPVVKKLDETPGYENLIRDSQRGTAVRNRAPEVRKSEPHQPPTRALNGIETDPTLVSNLLKESLAKPAPITVHTEKKSPIEEVLVKREIKREHPPEPIAQPAPVAPEPVPAKTEPLPVKTEPANPPTIQTEDVEHKHKKDKKKKEKHKHKDRDKSKEERKKHKKDKDRKKDSPPQPAQQPPEQPANDGALRITIPRDKLATSPGLKIKIPKERLAVPPPPSQQQTSGLKIKISKEVLETSRKRQAGPENGPPQKMQRQNGAPHPPKVGNTWNMTTPPPFRPQLPYYMVQPPPTYGMMGFVGMDGYYYPPMGYAPPQPQPPPRAPPLPRLPPPPVPPPPPE